MTGSRAVAATGFVVLLLLVEASAVAADVIDASGAFAETVTIGVDQWRAYRTSLSSLESWKFSVRVVQGDPVDVFMTNDFGFGQYTDPNATVFSYYPDASQVNTTWFPGTFPPPTGAQYYLIVDNARLTNGGATPTGPVIVEVSLAKTSLLPLLGGILVAIAAVTIGSIWFLRSRRRKRMPLRPPGGTPPAPPL